jgi:hypothetical protein
MSSTKKLGNTDEVDETNGVFKVDRSKKSNFINNAIEQGFTVRKLDNTSYEFSLPLGQRIPIENEEIQKNKRASSTPITKREKVDRIFPEN